jgi:hypothetical protein
MFEVLMLMSGPWSGSADLMNFVISIHMYEVHLLQVLLDACHIGL